MIEEDGYEIIKNKIDKLLKDLDNCSEENLNLIRIYRNAYEINVNVNSSYFSYIASILSVITLASSIFLDSSQNYNLYIGLGFLLFGVGLILWIGKKLAEDQNIAFGYYYLEYKMKLKIESNKIDNNNDIKELPSENNDIKMRNIDKSINKVKKEKKKIKNIKEENL